MKELHYERCDNPSAADVQVLSDKLGDSNFSKVGEFDRGEVSVFVRDGDGELVGGVHGEFFWGRMYVHRLWVDEARRGSGLGSKLMSDIEDIAREKGVTNIFLGTTTFQAMDFYLKNGYTIYASLESQLRGDTDYMLMKELEKGPLL